MIHGRFGTFNSLDSNEVRVKSTYSVYLKVTA